jgi:hypothetical protein
MAVTGSPQRRRPRSIAVTVAIALFSAASAVLAGAFVAAPSALLRLGLVAVLIMGWAALRVMWTEILAARFEHAAERSEAARAATSLASHRAAQNAAFVATMNARLATVRRTASDLTNAAAEAQHQAAQLGIQLRTEERRAGERTDRIAELEAQIESLLVEADIHRAGLTDLMSFEERVKRASTVEADDRRLA